MRQPSPEELRQLDPDGHFGQRLAADCAAILALRERSDREALQAIVHRLAGAAGTFGFTEVGELALMIDDRFTEGLPVTPGEIGTLVAALLRGIREDRNSA